MTPSPNSRHRLRWWAALISYLAVMVSLTTLKAYFQIGYLWDPAKQHAREIKLQPFDEFAGGTWFGPAFEYLGNFAFFVPFGVLAYIALPKAWKVAAIGLGVSLAIEIAQFAFALGRSDIDDLLMNALGALAGAGIAKLFGPRLHRVWEWLAITLAIVFAVLVILGPRLGDRDKVVDLQSAGTAPLAVSHVDELGIMQLVSDLNGVNRATAMLG